MRNKVAQRVTSHPNTRSPVSFAAIGSFVSAFMRVSLYLALIGGHFPFSNQFTGFADEKANPATESDSKSDEIAFNRVLGEPELSALQWTDVSLGDPSARTQPLFDLKKLLALAQPVQMDAQQGPQDVGGYLYNPESYISVDPRALKLVNHSRLQLLPERPLRAFFGLLHSHTFASDGIGDARDAFRMARDIAGLDFFAVTDHAEYWWKKASADWFRQQNLAREESRPNFVAMAGFEYSHPLQGHVVVLNSREWLSFFQARTLKGFFDWLALPEQKDARAIFAHPGFHAYRNWFDLQHFQLDARVKQQMIGVETVHKNVWSRSLKGYRGNKSHLDEAIDAGWHVGSIASQDNHSPYWGVSDQSRIAILADQLSQTALLEALSRRHFYSTQSPQLQLALGLYDGNTLRAILGDEVTRQSLMTLDMRLKLRIFEPNSWFRPQRIEFIVNGQQERKLTFLDNPSRLGEVGDDLNDTKPPWWDVLLNNRFMSNRVSEWFLDVRRPVEAEIFEVNVPLKIPNCSTLNSASQAEKQWSIVVRFYQGERGEYFTQTSPLIVRCG